jgi:hypothetical protein
MKKLPILSRTYFRVYWNDHLQPGITFDFNDALNAAFTVFNNGVQCQRNDVYFIDSYGTKYVRNKDTNTFKQSN